jgi:putative phage-type endonuclease
VIAQDDPAWVPARVGKLTASRMADAMDRRKDGKPGAGRLRLLHELLAERLVGSATNHYVTPAMQWGLDNEAGAADAYEAASGNILLPAGLVDHPTIEWFAATPDRLLDHDGLVEIKCPTTQTYIAWKLAGAVPDEHKAQMCAQLVCTGRRYVDFVAFDPRVPAKQRLFVRRYEPKREELEAVEEAARGFLDELDRMFEAFVTA